MDQLKPGTLVYFSESSGNPTNTLELVKSSEMHNSIVFYRLKRHHGALFTRDSLRTLDEVNALRQG